MVNTAERADLEIRLSIYRMMQEGRLFEQRAHDLFLEGLVKGTSHLGIGQEAVAAGFAAALRPDDLVFCTYRGHVHTLLRGAPMAPLMAELLGRGHRDLRRQGWLDAPHRRLARRDGLLRDRRGAHADRGGRGVGRAGARDGSGRRLLLRRRHHEHRDVPRGAEPGRGLEAAGRVRLREQPVHGVHGDRRRDGRRTPGGRPRRPPTAWSRSWSTATIPTRCTPRPGVRSTAPVAATVPRSWRR